MCTSEGLSPWHEANVETGIFMFPLTNCLSQPFQFGPPMGCNEHTFDSSSGSEGSLLTYKNFHRGSQNFSSPAIRSLLSVVKSFSHEKMDREFNRAVQNETEDKVKIAKVTKFL